MAIDWHTPLFSLWALVPLSALFCLLACVVYFRRHWIAMLAIGSLLAFGGIGLLLPLSWETHHDMTIWRNPRLPNGQIRHWQLGVESEHGGICLTNCFSLVTTELPIYIGMRKAPWNTNHGNYPIWGNRFSLIKSDFVQKKLGFQLCWGEGLEPSDASRIIYSITVPHWFVLALCPIFPLIWLRRHRRTRHLRRRGFPLTNSNPPSAHPPS